MKMNFTCKTVVVSMIFVLVLSGVVISEPASNANEREIALPSFVLKVQDQASYKKTRINFEQIAKFVVLMKRRVLSEIGKLEEGYTKPLHDKIYRSVLEENGIEEHEEKIEKFFSVLIKQSNTASHLKAATVYFSRVMGTISNETVAILNKRLQQEELSPSVLYYLARNKGTISENLEIPTSDHHRLIRYLIQKIEEEINDEKAEVSITKLKHVYASTSKVVQTSWNEEKAKKVFEDVMRFTEKHRFDGKQLNMEVSQGLEKIAKQNIDKKEVVRRVVDLLTNLMLDESISDKARYVTMGLGLSSILIDVYDNDPDSEIGNIAAGKLNKAESALTEADLIKSLSVVPNKEIYARAVELFDKSEVGTKQWHYLLIYFRQKEQPDVTARLIKQVKELDYSLEGIKKTRQETDHVAYNKRIRNEQFPRSPQESLATVLKYIPGENEINIDMSSPEKAKKSILSWWEKNKDNSKYHYKKSDTR